MTMFHFEGCLMANGENAAQKSNRTREFWSRRYHDGHGAIGRGPYAKRLTHRFERQAGKKQVRSE
jgi:hypothetical protein